MRKNDVAAMIFLDDAGSVTVNMSSLNATGRVQVQRFDPRQNAVRLVGTFAASGQRTFDAGNLDQAVIFLDAN